METITSRDNAKIKYACAVRDSEKQRAADGLLYPEVAYQYNSNLLQVVRSIDGFACASWRENAGLLCSLTCRPLTAAPTSAQFLRILTHCIRSGMV